MVVLSSRFMAETECTLHWDTYPEEPHMVSLVIRTPYGQPLMKASLNMWMNDYPNPSYHDGNHVFIKDYSENEGILDSLIKAGVLQDTGFRAKQGFVEIALCKILNRDPDNSARSDQAADNNADSTRSDLTVPSPDLSDDSTADPIPDAGGEDGGAFAKSLGGTFTFTSESPVGHVSIHDDNLIRRMGEVLNQHDLSDEAQLGKPMPDAPSIFPMSQFGNLDDPTFPSEAALIPEGARYPHQFSTRITHPNERLSQLYSVQDALTRLQEELNIAIAAEELNHKG